MIITAVRARILRRSPHQAVVFAAGSYNTFSLVLVEVETEDGTIGHGEAIARRAPEMAKATVESLLAPVIIGRDARNIGGLWVEMVDQLRRWGHVSGVVLEAVSGVDCALWDIAGKRAGEPVWRLLQGAGREHVPSYASSVYIADYETMCAEASVQVASGFHCVKVKVGRSPEHGGPRSDVESVRRIRAEVGNDVDLAVDANSAYDVATAIQVARELEPLGVKWLEEPIVPDDLEGYARIRAMTTTPLAAGESAFAVFGFRELVGGRLIDYAQPDLARCGGVTAAYQIAALCYTHNVAFAPHTGFSGGLSHLAALHVAAAAPTLDRLEYMFIDNPARELFVEGYPKPDGDTVRAPSAPGFGLELDSSVVDAMAVAP